MITRRFQFFSMDQFHHHALPCLFHQLHYLIFDIAKPRLLQQRMVTSVPFQRCTAWPFRLKSHCKFRTYVSELGQYLSSMTVALVWFEVGRRGKKKKIRSHMGKKWQIWATLACRVIVASEALSTNTCSVRSVTFCPTNCNQLVGSPGEECKTCWQNPREPLETPRPQTHRWETSTQQNTLIFLTRSRKYEIQILKRSCACKTRS